MSEKCQRCGGTGVIVKADYSEFVPCPECAQESEQ